MKWMVVKLSLLLVLPLALMLVLIMPGAGYQETKATTETITTEDADADTDADAETIVKPSNVTTGSAVQVEPVKQITKKKPVGKTTYLVKVDRQEQQMSVWLIKDGVKKAIRTMPCATGKKYTPTPKGTFHMKRIGKFLYDRKYHCYLKYVIQFHGGYLIHSVPVSATGKVLDQTMGKPASHGCIRLRIEDAKWLYQQPLATKLLIE